jgi:hypothetical protein
LDNLGIIKKPCGAHRQPPVLNHEPTALRQWPPPPPFRAHDTVAVATPPTVSAPHPPPLAAIKGAQPPVNDLFFLLRLRRHCTIALPSLSHRVMLPPVPLRSNHHRLSSAPTPGAPSTSLSVPQAAPLLHHHRFTISRKCPRLTPLSPQIISPVLLRALSAGPTNLIARRRRNSAEPPSTGAIGASSPALGLRPTSHVG